MKLFSKKTYIPVEPKSSNLDYPKPSVPDNLYIKCPSCYHSIYKKQLGKFDICPDCNHHFRISSRKMLSIISDDNDFEEILPDLSPKNYINYPEYDSKIKNLIDELDINEAVLCAKIFINGIEIIACIMDSRFIMGSMGSVVGEKITKSFEIATESMLPIVIFTASGGARMQEGIISLMQMAKISAACKRHSDSGLLYISVLCDPTTGGVSASFAMQADIILAEPNSLVGFAGKRVIEQTLKHSLPEGFQSSEFVLNHGFIDSIVSRSEIKSKLHLLLKINTKNESNEDIINFKNYNIQKNKDAYECVKLSRDIKRPTNRAIINSIITDFQEFFGDRSFADDGAIIGGIGYLDNMPITIIATQKGENLEQNIKINFGQPHPEGYRKALRLMKQAEKFRRPILTLINTSGAYPGIGAEERGQAHAIATNLFEMSSFKVPIIAIITGEGGSGGALALALADRVYMFENAIYSILSPEGFASILWKDAKKAPDAAAIMKLKSSDLMNLEIIEGIIPEADMGFQSDPKLSIDYLKSLLINEFNILLNISIDELINKRYLRFRKFGN